MPRREAFGEPERPRILGGGLAVRAERSRALGGLPARSEHRVAVARRLGMVREPREIGSAVGGSRAPRAPSMKSDLRFGAQRLLDGKAGELVAEATPVRP